ncbi:alpha/beta fold hydrolase [Kordiimonas marina]|uniref:alpha/beta fold hydrolase n=1 Tax=Kordiimonas marina TaxID=2872312 RepID=UPI001FF45F22|nr:alpha/beta fold hydrolase [Kordiimonas marina]MCJ9430526.1 alpha/beta hydrolase [Kordiimonas marina]
MSDEHFCTLKNGIKLCYKVEGEGEPVLLIAGLTLQLHSWPRPMVEDLMARGFQVITYDNRDVGRSSRHHAAPPTKMQMLTRKMNPANYDLGDMAGDAAGLLDHLGLKSVHVAGMSMGGMIGQTLAARAPGRVKTLTSIFSTTGARSVGQPSFRMLLRMMAGPPATREEAIRRYIETMRIIGGRGHAINEERCAAYMGEAWDRGGANPHIGIGRQLAAILKSGDRTAEVQRISVPTLVIHGDRDPMVNASGGKATAAAIKGSRHISIKGMGHDLADSVNPELVSLFADHVGAV